MTRNEMSAALNMFIFGTLTNLCWRAALYIINPPRLPIDAKNAFELELLISGSKSNSLTDVSSDTVE
jgi:hypothetical protein